VPAVFYSFSFAPNPKWTTFFPPGEEIYNYLEEVCNKFGVIEKLEFNTDVHECKWLEGEGVWELHIRHLLPGMGDLSEKDRRKKIATGGEQAVVLGTEVIRTKVLLSCVGGLVEPKGWPDEIPGIETFKGSVFHSARWNYDVDFKDKDVVVVGTGCSAAQFVPKLTQAPYNAKSVVQLMRSPPWVVPRIKPPLGDRLWRKYSSTGFTYIPGLLKLMRFAIFAAAEYDFRLFGEDDYHKKQRAEYEKKLLRSMKRVVPEKYHEMLTPDYGVGCKRRIFDATWFPGLADPKVELTTQPLKSVQEQSVILGPGQYYPEKSESPPQRQVPADVIVLANGFDVTRWLHPLKVVGRNGKDLIEVMDERGGPQAYQGTAMDGFPNFFIIFGPNTATGHSSVIMASENMANYAMLFVKKILQGDAKTIEVKKAAEQEWTADIQTKLKTTVWMSGGCSSWYFKDGWNSTMLPYVISSSSCFPSVGLTSTRRYSQVWFWYRCAFPRWRDWSIQYTTKGTLKRVFSQSIKGLVIATLIVGAYQARKSGIRFKDHAQVWANSLKETSQVLLNAASNAVRGAP
jgi:cation diffusion facilitator CzcD-associated flavoprotein CzcO